MASINPNTHQGKRHAALLPPVDTAQLPGALKNATEKYRWRFEDERNLVWEDDECNSILYVLEGWLGLYKTLANGRMHIVDFALPGDLVDPSGADGMTASVTVQAFTDGTAAAVPSTVWERMLNDSPDLFDLAQQLESARHARRAERMLRVGKGAAEMRVAYALLELCIRISSVDEAAGRSFYIPITQQQLGDFVGLSSVHVCRTMRRLSRNGIIEMSDHMIIRLLDLEALAKIAGVDWRGLGRAILPVTFNRRSCA